jgi:hypothetical protein
MADKKFSFILEDLSERDRERLAALPSHHLEATPEGMVFSCAFKNMNGAPYKGATAVAEILQSTFNDSRSVNTLRVKASKIRKDSALLDKVLTAAETAYTLDKQAAVAQQASEIGRDRRNWREGIKEIREIAALTGNLGQTLGQKAYKAFETGIQRHQQHTARALMQTMEFAAHIQGQADRETVWREAYRKATGKSDATNPGIAVLQSPQKLMTRAQKWHRGFETTVEKGIERDQRCFDHLYEGVKGIGRAIAESTLTRQIQRTASAISQKAQDDLALIHAIVPPQSTDFDATTNEKAIVIARVDAASGHW